MVNTEKSDTPRRTTRRSSTVSKDVQTPSDKRDENKTDSVEVIQEESQIEACIESRPVAVEEPIYTQNTSGDSDGADDIKTKDKTGKTTTFSTKISLESLDAMKNDGPLNDKDKTEISSVKERTKDVETESTLETKLNGVTKENTHSTEDKTSDNTSEKVDDVGQDNTMSAGINEVGEENEIKNINEKVGVEKDSNQIVPELEEQVNKNSNIVGSPITQSKTKIKLNIIPKDDDDIVEIPVVKPKIDIIDVPDEEIGDTEVVSEDELPPPPSKEKVDGAEEVSDEELPAVPKPDLPPEGAEEVSDEELPAAPKADLPPEAEDVSDDELLEPVEKKKKLETKSKPGVPVTEAKTKEPVKETEKLAKVADNISKGTKRPLEETNKQDILSPKENEVKKPREKSPEKPKKLPELQQYWKAVKENPTDFTGWTYLLKYVDQESDVEAAEEAYSTFLTHYPYCYGYWRKYADYERKKGTQAKCEEIFDQGLKAIPLSVDLWIHFLNYVKSVYADNPEYIREQYQKCVNICGLEFRADPLWDSYIKWEISQKELIRARELYDRLLTIPLHGKTIHFENFQNFVASNSPKDILPVEEFLALRKEILPALKKSTDSPMLAEDENKPPGADDYAPPGEEPAEVVVDADEANAIRDKIVLSRKKIHKETTQAVAERWFFEERIKRPYFHVKALEKCQLKNWKDYLDFEISKGNEERIEVLFERCLIACALYEEFWYQYICYLRKKPNLSMDKIGEIFTRACTVHHPRKANLHFEWAAFEEKQGNGDKAREVLEKLEKEHPELVEIPMRRIALEKRLKQTENVCNLYKKYLDLWNTKPEDHRHYFNLTIKAARYYSIVLKDVDKAVEILKRGLEKEKEIHSLQEYTRLNFQLVDSELHRPEIDIKRIVSYLDAMISDKPSLTVDQKFLIVTRKLELLEEFGNDILLINKTIQEFRSVGHQVKSAQESHKPPPLPPAEPKDKKEIPTQIISSVRKPKNAPLPIELPPTPAPSVPVHQQAPPQNVFYPGPPSQQMPPYVPQNQFPPPQGPYPGGVAPPPNYNGPYAVDPNNPMVYHQWYGGPNFPQGNWGGVYPGNFQSQPQQRRY